MLPMCYNFGLEMGIGFVVNSYLLFYVTKLLLCNPVGDEKNAQSKLLNLFRYP